MILHSLISKFTVINLPGDHCHFHQKFPSQLGEIQIRKGTEGSPVKSILIVINWFENLLQSGQFCNLVPLRDLKQWSLLQTCIPRIIETLGNLIIFIGMLDKVDVPFGHLGCSLCCCHSHNHIVIVIHHHHHNDHAMCSLAFYAAFLVSLSS